MSAIARWTVSVGLFLYALAIDCPRRILAETPAQPVEVLRQMPKAVANTEQPVPELLPLPQELVPDATMWDEPYPFHPPTRINRYEVWQFYEVGHYGQFRPRVIYSAYGSFYLYDGRPYPWMSTHQRDFMPVLVGP